MDARIESEAQGEAHVGDEVQIVFVDFVVFDFHA